MVPGRSGRGGWITATPRATDDEGVDDEGRTRGTVTDTGQHDPSERRAVDPRPTPPWLVPLWSLLLAVLLLGPALAPGYVLSFDMVWVPDLALRPDVWGLGSGLPRAVPSDAVVGLLDEVVGGMVLQKLVLLGSLVAGGVGAARLAPGPTPVRLLAVGLWQWNPFVVERLVLGAWPVLVAYAALPWLLLLAREWRAGGRVPRRLWLVVPLACLSASAGLASALVLVLAAWGRGRRRAVLAMAAAGNAPWLVAGALHASVATTDAAGARLFALQGEGAVPGPLAALTLGGVWNVEVVPPSRLGATGWVALVVLTALALLGSRAWWRATVARERGVLLAAWATGWLLAVLTWAAPDALGSLAASVPGLGLLRDGSRLLLLCAPLLVLLVAHGAGVLLALARRPATPVLPLAVAGAAVLLPVALLPDATWGAAGRLGAVDFPSSWAAARPVVSAAAASSGGDVLVLPASSYRQPAWNDDRKVLDPLGRYLAPDYVADDSLVVDRTAVAGEDPRARAALAALDAGTPEAAATDLAALGVAVVVVDLEAAAALSADVPEVAGQVLVDGPGLRVVRLGGVEADPAPRTWVVALVLAWAAYLGGPAVVCVLALATGARATARRVLRKSA